MSAIPVPRFDQFYRHAELTRLLQDYAAAAPQLVQLSALGRSHEGRDIWLLTITNQATGADTDKPAFWIDGNIHAAELTASIACLYYLHQLVNGDPADAAAVQATCWTRAWSTWCPRLNPDGAELALADRPRHIRSVRHGVYPYEEAPVDGLTVEDIDGDGRVLQMRVRDPHGGWKVCPARAAADGAARTRRLRRHATTASCPRARWPSTTA